MNKKILSSTVAGLIAFFLLVLADLVPFWMPMMGEMVVLLAVTMLLMVWAGFVLQENAADEREVLLKMHAGRVAYLSGLAFLMLALLVQGIESRIDPWIAGALAVMVVSKLLTRLYLD